MELVRLFGFFFPFVQFLSGLTILVMLAIGGVRVINGLMTPGSLVAMFRYLGMLIWPLMGAGFMVNMIQRGAVSLGRINEIMNTVPSIRDCENPQTSEKSFSVEQTFSVPALELKNLKFSYNEKETVLNSLNLKIMRGEWLGIMGRTGSGKSTLIKTFTRTIDPPKESVSIFGLDIRDWPLEELRELFAVSPQDSYLFSDSIANNITYGYTDKSGSSEHSSADNYKSSLDRAVKFASLEKDLEIFQSGKETLIGERGLTLSGGQKQRTAIARAIIMNAEFLILDDSLSAVDNETEQKIMEALRNERKNRTTIIISHRVSTLKYADKVMVLDKGKMIEYGLPAQLVSSGGFYSRMAAFQRLELHPEKENG
jgi:ATP-binding cassette subfamily B protein